MDALIVEDNRSFRQVFRDYLLDLHPFLRIGEAADAREAMEKISTRPPALAFVDINLPGMSGLELTAWIKARCPGARVLVMTSLGDSALGAAALAAGADAFFVKGAVAGKAFVDRVQALIDEIQANDSARHPSHSGPCAHHQ